MLVTHKEDVSDVKLFDKFGKLVQDSTLKNDSEYYNFKLKSKDFNLYRNINLIPFFKYEDGSDDMDKQIERNV